MDFSKIKAFAFDVDGVATECKVFCDMDGNLLRAYDAKDGFAVRMACMNGYPVAVITGGRSESIRKRFITSGVKPDDVYLGSRIKTEQLQDFCNKYGILPENVFFMGDDVPDITCIRAAGIGACPSDAEWTELRTKCTWTWVTNYNGSGINGRLITATNGNSIFLPAAGDRDDTDLNGAGSYGNYWSSSLVMGYPDYAWCVYFDSDNVSRFDYLHKQRPPDILSGGFLFIRQQACLHGWINKKP